MAAPDLTESSCTALVGDADAGTRRLCRTVLAEAGYVVGEAADGSALVARARSHPPDIVVAAERLPGADLPHLLQSLRSVDPTRHTPVLLLIEPGNDLWVIANLAGSVDDYLIKPVRPAELAARVKVLTCRNGSAELHHELLGEHARVLTLLLDLSATLAGSDRLEHLLQTTVEAAVSVVPCRRAAVLLPDADLQCLRIAGALGVDDRTVAELTIPIAESLAGRVYASGASLVVNAASAVHLDQQTCDSHMYSRPPALALPMRASDRTVGVLYLAERLGRQDFSTRELDYLGLLSNCAASATDGALARRSREEAHQAITVALASLAEHRDNDTGRHLERMAGFCVILAEQLKAASRTAGGIDAAFVTDLRQAAPLHDIGKVAIPDHILLKPGKLTAEEMEVMRRHATVGAETIRSARSRSPESRFLAMAEEIADGHHEWVDGSGYPRGLRGAEIPLSARIAAVADVYDALTTRRVYKDAMPHVRAKAIVVDLAGRQFDPLVVEAFLAAEEAIRQLAAELRDEIDSDQGTVSRASDGPTTAAPRDHPQLVPCSRIST